MVVDTYDYEECRRKRVEENKKRMEELNLAKYAQALRTTANPKLSQMIFAAIDALKEKDGSNQLSILKHIESTYGDLSADTMNLLTHHLKKMKESGELVMVKNNYSRPDLNAPPKRGRGRPRKPRDPSAPEVAAVVARPRGRPRKDPNAPPAPKKGKLAGQLTMMPSKTGRARRIPCTTWF